MAQRFASSLHQRDSRSALFAGYTGDRAPNQTTPSPNGGIGGGYGYSGRGGYSTPQSASPENHGYRSATPNKRGQYSDAVLSELESQNDEQVAGILGKVKVLKSMTVAIGDEIRESSALAEKMNHTFDSTRLRMRSTMNRMLIMAQRSGVSWKWWLLFFIAVTVLFVYVWLF